MHLLIWIWPSNLAWKLSHLLIAMTIKTCIVLCIYSKLLGSLRLFSLNLNEEFTWYIYIQAFCCGFFCLASRPPVHACTRVSEQFLQSYLLIARRWIFVTTYSVVFLLDSSAAPLNGPNWICVTTAFLPLKHGHSLVWATCRVLTYATMT